MAEVSGFNWPIGGVITLIVAVVGWVWKVRDAAHTETKTLGDALRAEMTNMRSTHATVVESVRTSLGAQIETVEKDLADYKLVVAMGYVTNAQFHKLEQRIDVRFDRTDEKLDRLLERRAKSEAAD